MPFSDDFSGGVTGADLTTGTPSGGTAWTHPTGARWLLQYTTDAINAAGSGVGGGNSVYLCDDQGSSDQYVAVKTISFPYAAVFAATRMSAGSYVGGDSSCVGVTLYGTGGAGRRLTKVGAGGPSSVDLITSQGVSGEWLKVESEGENHRLFSGGTGAAPIWGQVGSDVSNEFISDTNTGAGILLDTTNAGNYVSYFEAGVLGAPPTTLTLTSITPTTGPATGGTTVTIYGSGFLSGTPEPRFNGVLATDVAVVNDTELTCVTPAL